MSSMNIPVCYKCREENVWLSPERTLFWEKEKALIVADLHFGKTGHFRKSGIGIPQQVFMEDIQRLIDQLTRFKVEQLIIVGDMFHSIANKELELFSKWRADFPNLQIDLVKGNHDILTTDWYAANQIMLHAQSYTKGPFRFVHDIQSNKEAVEAGIYTYTGHIHPGIKLNGTAKQSLRFPCFYFGNQYSVLPAFSRFTGLHLIEPKRNETVYALTDKQIIQVQ